MEVKTAAEKRRITRNAAMIAEYHTLTGKKMAKYEHLAAKYHVSKSMALRICKASETN